MLGAIGSLALLPETLSLVVGSTNYLPAVASPPAVSDATIVTVHPAP